MAKRKRQMITPENDDESLVDEGRPSRSQKKRDARATEPLALRLVKLSPGRLKGLDLDPQLHDAVLACQRLGRGARQRQIKRIMSLLHHEDWSTIEQSLSQS